MSQPLNVNSILAARGVQAPVGGAPVSIAAALSKVVQGPTAPASLAVQPEAAPAPTAKPARTPAELLASVEQLLTDLKGPGFVISTANQVMQYLSGEGRLEAFIEQVITRQGGYLETRLEQLLVERDARLGRALPAEIPSDVEAHDHDHGHDHHDHHHEVQAPVAVQTPAGHVNGDAVDGICFAPLAKIEPAQYDSTIVFRAQLGLSLDPNQYELETYVVQPDGNTVPQELSPQMMVALKSLYEKNRDHYGYGQPYFALLCTA
jgi:hypothetical protein